MSTLSLPGADLCHDVAGRGIPVVLVHGLAQTNGKVERSGLDYGVRMAGCVRRRGGGPARSLRR
jgi:hypothetical protein